MYWVTRTYEINFVRNKGKVSKEQIAVVRNILDSIKYDATTSIHERLVKFVRIFQKVYSLTVKLVEKYSNGEPIGQEWICVLLVQMLEAYMIYIGETGTADFEYFDFAESALVHVTVLCTADSEPASERDFAEWLRQMSMSNDKELRNQVLVSWQDPQPVRTFSEKSLAGDSDLSTSDCWLYEMLGTCEDSMRHDSEVEDCVIIGVIGTGVNLREADIYQDNFQTVNQYLGSHTLNWHVPPKFWDPPIDNHGHGTQVASLIASQREYSCNHVKRRIGLSHKTKILPCKISEGAHSSTDDILRAFCSVLGRKPVTIESILLDRTEDEPAHAVNMVVITSTWENEGGKNIGLARTLKYFDTIGVPIVAAAGNDGSETSIQYPGVEDSVIAVGSLCGKLSENGIFLDVSVSSNRSDNVKVYAPGERVPTIDKNGELKIESGTSFAAPILAGCLANNFWSIKSNGLSVVDSIARERNLGTESKYSLFNKPIKVLCRR
ncbi:MAG: S8/S53 family peptidase [Planctomycetales bacterium]|nr:MAG: S8/S53 family peptidase [Planctomycetales bacterium]